MKKYFYFNYKKIDETRFKNELRKVFEKLDSDLKYYSVIKTRPDILMNQVYVLETLKQIFIEKKISLEMAYVIPQSEVVDKSNLIFIAYDFNFLKKLIIKYIEIEPNSHLHHHFNILNDIGPLINRRIFLNKIEFFLLDRNQIMNEIISNVDWERSNLNMHSLYWGDVKYGDYFYEFFNEVLAKTKAPMDDSSKNYNIFILPHSWGKKL